jgi:hypothetical protein
MAAEAGMQVREILCIIGSVKPPGLEAWFQSSHRSSLFYIRSDAEKRNSGSKFYQTVKNCSWRRGTPENQGKLIPVNPGRHALIRSDLSQRKHD